MEKLINLKLKALITALLLVFIQAAITAQESLEVVYAQLDSAIGEHSSESVSKVLTKYTASKDYGLYESFTLKKARQLIIQDDLIFARDVTLVVIDNNLENFDAVDLYSYIDRAILSEEAARIAEENRLRIEAERLAALNERTRAKIAKNDNYSSVSTASGSSIYINHEKYFSSTDWSVSVGLADIMYQTVTKPESYSSLKYGLAFGANLFYKTEEYIVGGELFADLAMLTMGKGEQEVITSLKFVPMFALPNLSKNLFLRVGFAMHGLNSDSEFNTGSVETFISPAFGFAFENIALGKSTAELFYDYYLGHLAYDDLSSAMEMGAAVLLPMAGNEQTTIGLKLGVTDTLFLKDEGMDNRAKFIISIGVGNVKN